VKKIEVASVLREDDTALPFIRLEGIEAQKHTLRARMSVHKLMKTGQSREKTIIFNQRPSEATMKDTMLLKSIKLGTLLGSPTVWRYFRDRNLARIRRNCLRLRLDTPLKSIFVNSNVSIAEALKFSHCFSSTRWITTLKATA
jgi:hypothetical protein